MAPKLIKYKKLFYLLDKLLHTKEINQFISSNQHLKIFCFLMPSSKSLSGAVTVPGHYPKTVLQHLVDHYAFHFPPPTSAPKVNAKNPFSPQPLVSTATLKASNKALMQSMKQAGVKLPVLFKQYTDLCESGGVGFLNFARDPQFQDCVDGLIWLELAQMKAQKRNKYINHHWEQQLQQHQSA